MKTPTAERVLDQPNTNPTDEFLLPPINQS